MNPAVDFLKKLGLFNLGEKSVEVCRSPHLPEKVVFVDGQAGCGKTMFSAIIAALERVELLTYAYEIEFVCALHSLGKIQKDAASTLIKMLTDLQLYNTMLGRQTNFRPSDLSSIFRDPRPMRYLKRIFQKGEDEALQRIAQQKPILHLSTHYLLSNAEPVFAALKERVLFVEIVRHPLYMIKQQTHNKKTLFSNVRDFTIYTKYKDTEVPYWTLGWEELFLSSNDVEKSIYEMEKRSQVIQTSKEYLIKTYNAQIFTIPFESYVLNPWGYMEELEKRLDTKMTSLTKKIMKKQRVPRRMYAEGINLKVYKRYGWQPPQPQSNELQEFELRRKFASEHSSAEAMKTLDGLCDRYEEKYLGGVKKVREHYV